MDRRLLIDNDAFILFAGTDLLFDAIQVLGFTLTQALRLEALPHMLGKSKSIQKRYPPDVITKARTACNDIAGLQGREADATILDRLIGAHDAINGGPGGGEALLFTLAIEAGYSVLTGDRRALVALGQAPNIDDLRALLANRLVCLEIVLRLLAEKLGVADLSGRLTPIIPIHHSLKVFFSAGCQADHSQCFTALNQYFLALQDEVGVSLLMNPFPDLSADPLPEES